MVIKTISYNNSNSGLPRSDLSNTQIPDLVSKKKISSSLSNQQDLDDFNDEHFHVTGIEAILIFEGQICNCFTVPLSIDNSASLSQLSKIVGEVNLQIFLNKIIVWFDTVTPEKSCH